MIKNTKDISRISKIVCKPNIEMSIRHYVHLKTFVKEPSRDNVTHLYNERDFIFDYELTEKTVNKTYIGRMICGDSYFTIQNDIKVDNNVIPAKAYITIADISQVKHGIIEAYKWLTDDNYEDIFTVDTKGNTVGISNKKIHHVIRLRYNKYILLQPAVIADIDDISYQGVQLKNEKGIIGSLTAAEYETFKMVVLDLCNNFYSTSLILLNTGLATLATDNLIKTN